MPVILLYRKMRKLQLEGVLYMSSWRASSCTENKVHISCVSNVWWCFSSSSSFWVCYYFRNISGSSYGEPFHLAAWNAISLPICFPKTTESLMTQIWIKKIVHCLSLWGTLGNITKPLLAKLLCTTADSIKTVIVVPYGKAANRAIFNDSMHCICVYMCTCTRHMCGSQSLSAPQGQGAIMEYWCRRGVGEKRAIIRFCSHSPCTAQTQRF